MYRHHNHNNHNHDHNHITNNDKFIIIIIIMIIMMIILIIMIIWIIKPGAALRVSSASEGQRRAKLALGLWEITPGYYSVLFGKTTSYGPPQHHVGAWKNTSWTAATQRTLWTKEG